MTDEGRLSGAMFLSLLFHLLLFLMLQAQWMARQDMPSPESLLDVDVIELPPPPKPAPPAPKMVAKAPPAPQVKLPESDIVPMPDLGEERPSDTARFLSDRDNVVERQSVKKGESWENQRAAAPEKPDQAEAPKLAPPLVKDLEPKKPKVAEAKKDTQKAQAKKEPQRLAALPKLDQLLPNAGDFAVAEHAKADAAPKSRDETPAPRHLMTGRPAALSSRPGVAAYLPTVQAGDLTLLNTKASQFAPFVRRVAARVFQHLEINLRQSSNATVAGNGHEYAEVEAIMNKRGELVSANLQQRESETQLGVYRLLMSATKPDVFFDRNPPPGAAAGDGNIHFILMVDLQVAIANDPESGRRGTSYYGVAGVGLK